VRISKPTELVLRILQLRLLGARNSSSPWHAIQEGDVLVKVNGAKFESRNPQELVSYIDMVLFAA
jgi:hypothetical protein